MTWSQEKSCFCSVEVSLQNGTRVCGTLLVCEFSEVELSNLMYRSAVELREGSLLHWRALSPTT